MSVAQSWRHRAACPRSRRLRTRAAATERTLARVCREAGTTVRFNVKLRDKDIAVDANDERAIEVVASGLPLQHGAQLAVDTTLRRPDSRRHSSPKRSVRGRSGVFECQSREGTQVRRIADRGTCGGWWWLRWTLAGYGATKLFNSLTTWQRHEPGRHHQSSEDRSSWGGGDDGAE